MIWYGYAMHKHHLTRISCSNSQNTNGIIVLVAILRSAVSQDRWVARGRVRSFIQWYDIMAWLVFPTTAKVRRSNILFSEGSLRWIPNTRFFRKHEPSGEIERRKMMTPTPGCGLKAFLQYLGVPTALLWYFTGWNNVENKGHELENG